VSKLSSNIKTESAVLERELKLKEQQLNSLLRVTMAINGNVSVSGLLNLYENMLVKNLGVKKLALFIHNTRWTCTNAYGFNRDTAEELMIKYLLSFKQFTSLKKTRHVLADQFEVVIPVYHGKVPVIFTFIESFDEEHGTMEDQLNYIQTISGVIAMAIENKRLNRVQVKQKFMKSEMELARQMQGMLMRGQLPDNERVSMAGTYLPYQEVGGDYYDYVELNENSFIFLIADIAGQGIAAALLMASFQASLRSYVETENSFLRLVENLNARVIDITKGEKFITLFIAKYDHASCTMEYVNAGHNPPVLFHKGEIKLLQEGCTILGMFDKLPYVHVQKIYLPGEFVTFCYTDGLIDIQNDQNVMLDVSHLISFLKKNNHLTTTEINKAMVDFIVGFKGTTTIRDDISILTCKVFNSSRH
jgi:sigma-B regulation protein RsbU (phosphoserine phosphatase)